MNYEFPDVHRCEKCIKKRRLNEYNWNPTFHSNTKGETICALFQAGRNFAHPTKVNKTFNFIAAAIQIAPYGRMNCAVLLGIITKCQNLRSEKVLTLFLAISGRSRKTELTQAQNIKFTF